MPLQSYSIFERFAIYHMHPYDISNADQAATCLIALAASCALTGLGSGYEC